MIGEISYRVQQAQRVRSHAAAVDWHRIRCDGEDEPAVIEAPPPIEELAEIERQRVIIERLRRQVVQSRGQLRASRRLIDTYSRHLQTLPGFESRPRLAALLKMARQTVDEETW